MTQLAKPY